MMQIIPSYLQLVSTISYVSFVVTQPFQPVQDLSIIVGCSLGSARITKSGVVTSVSFHHSL